MFERSPWDVVAENLFKVMNAIGQIETHKINLNGTIYTDEKVAYLSTHNSEEAIKVLHFEIRILKSLLADLNKINENKDKLLLVVSDEKRIDKYNGNYLKLIIKQIDPLLPNYTSYYMTLCEILVSIENNKSNIHSEFWTNLLMKLYEAKKIINLKK